MCDSQGHCVNVQKSVPVVFECLLQLPTLPVDIAEVGVGLGQQGVLLDGQGAEVRGPASVR